MAKKNSPYFNDFITMSNFSCRAAEYLQSVLKNFNPEDLSKNRNEMHEIELAADKQRHDMMQRLVKEFVTPIGREDIISLANRLDNLTDKIDDILIRMYMYNITELRKEAVAFADVIVKSCKALHVVMQEFPNFQKSTTLMQSIIDVNSAEEEGDLIYINAVRDLYLSESDPVQITAWSELFEKLEDCCDACEDVADMLGIIILKNS